jgi:1,2-diacylglycerol 3-alpha-glucosyltransferase
MSLPRRIAMVAACPFPSPQGSQVFVGQMAEELAARGHDVHLLTYGQGHEVLGRGYRHHRVPRLPGDDASRSGPTLVKPLLDLMLLRELTQLVDRERIELVHSHNYEATVCALASRVKTGVPVVYHSHNLFSDELPTYFSGRFAKFAAAKAGTSVDTRVPLRCDHVIALCEWSLQRLTAFGVDPAQISVVPPAVRDDGLLGSLDEARQQLAVEQGDFVIGYAGNLDAYQNLPLLLEGFERLVAQAPSEPSLLLLATHGRDPGIEARIRRLGDRARLIRVEGYAETRRLMAACDVLALPRSEGSGYPIKLLNYMSGGRVIVVGGCGAKVLSDGVDGVVVGDNAPEELARALADLRSSPERARGLAENARRTYLKRLTWEVVLPQVEAIYDSVLTKGTIGA